MNKARTIASTALSLSLMAVGPAWGSCYTIYGPRNTVVYQSAEPPIDLSRTISSQLALRYPGHHLVRVNDARACPTVQPRGRGTAQPLAGASGEALVDSPLFRDALPMLSSSTISGSGSGGPGRMPVMNRDRGVTASDGSMRSGAAAGR